jgi:hypothetical protein
MEGVEFIQTEDGRWLEQDTAAIAKADYDKKQLTESRKVELFTQFINKLTGK